MQTWQLLKRSGVIVECRGLFVEFGVDAPPCIVPRVALQGRYVSGARDENVPRVEQITGSGNLHRPVSLRQGWLFTVTQLSDAS